MSKTLFSIVDKYGKHYKMQTGGGCWQWYFFEKDLEMLNTTCEMLNASNTHDKCKPYCVKQIM